MKTRPELLRLPAIPPALHGVSPRVIKGEEWWDSERKAAYARTEYRCAACGIPKADAMFHDWLEAHEVYAYDYKEFRATLVEIVALCHACHNYIHSGRMLALVNAGKMEPEKRAKILIYGDVILRQAGLTRTTWPDIHAGWGKWHLLLDGKKYYGKFKSKAEWERFYRKVANESET